MLIVMDRREDEETRTRVNGLYTIQGGSSPAIAIRYPRGNKHVVDVVVEVAVVVISR